MNVCTPDEQDEAPWPATYIRLCKLPKYWICAFLKNKSSHIAPAQADQLFDGHGNLMMEVFCFVTGTGVELQFPKGSHDKRVCTQVFSTRLSETGGRLAAIERPLLELLTGKAKFDWQSLGIYRFEPPADEESRVTHILHISGVKAKIPERYVVTMESKIMNNFSESAAQILEDGEDTGLSISVWFKKGVSGTAQQEALYKMCSHERFQQLGLNLSDRKLVAKQLLDEAKTKDAPEEVMKATPAKRRRTHKASEVKVEEED